MPFRDDGSDTRTAQFFWLLDTYLPIFIKQKTQVQFFIINQGGHPLTPFNRAKLLNVGFDIASAGDFDCFFFSDVDLMPLDDRVPLKCVEKPRHYSAWLDSQDFKIYYENIFGGTTAFTAEAFRRANGYSNQFWGSGGEDDEMSLRVRSTTGFVRTDQRTAHFHRLFHKHEKTNARILTLAQCQEHFKCSAKRYKSDGLNTLDYEILEEENLGLIRNITVDLKFSTTKQPGKLCKYDKLFEILGKLFQEKILRGSAEDFNSNSNWFDGVKIFQQNIFSLNVSESFQEIKKYQMTEK